VPERCVLPGINGVPAGGAERIDLTLRLGDRGRGGGGLGCDTAEPSEQDSAGDERRHKPPTWCCKVCHVAPSRTAAVDVSCHWHSTPVGRSARWFLGSDPWSLAWATTASSRPSRRGNRAFRVYRKGA